MANILIGVTGGISAYKIPSVVSVLYDKCHKIKVIMTTAAQKFITPLTFSALSHEKVYTDEDEFANDGHINHIELAEWADCILIAPATFNTIFKIVRGITDNLLTSTIVPYQGMMNKDILKRLIICPAMNTNMYNQMCARVGTVQLSIPKSICLGPVKGKLACGTEGMGKMIDTKTIVDTIEGLV